MEMEEVNSNFDNVDASGGGATMTEGQARKAHSVKVPRLYKEAAKALQNIQKNGEGLKSALYSIKHPNKKALTALVSETLRHKAQLDSLIKKSRLVEQEPGLSVPLAQILITELIWGKQRLGGEAKPLLTIMKYKEKFSAILSKVERRNRGMGIISSEDQGIESREIIRKPRYVRVNTLLAEFPQVLEWLEEEGWVKKDAVKDLGPDDFCIDPVVENLLVFSPQTQFHSHPLYLNGTLVLQDKASCLPALALKPRRGRKILDACAAPGMKTSLLAALMQNDGSILAVEKSQKRCSTLKSMIDSLGVTCVTVENRDFTDIPPEEHPDVEYILVDPSCSGSGMVGRIDAHVCQNGKDGERSGRDFHRLESLSFCQKKLLLHAMKFPGVKRIVYSTCSIYPEENEDVLATALLWEGEEGEKFRLKRALPQWAHRVQNPNYAWADNCVAADYETDGTDGFFVAVLERIKIKGKRVKEEEY